VTGPSWLAGAFAAAMIGIALYCAGRLALSGLRRRETEIDADGMHVAMGVAMAGMLVPRLSPLPGSVWEVVFASAAVWFGWQAIRTRSGSARGGWRCPYPVPHLVECAAMLYMLLAVPGSRPAGAGAGMSMPGMGGSPGTTGEFPALAVVLALFMVGYVVWTTDQLASTARARTAGTAQNATRDTAGPPRVPATLAASGRREVAAAGALGAATSTLVPAMSTLGAATSTLVPATSTLVPATSTLGATASWHQHAGASLMLAPRLAACYKIAMGITMGYMLILML
jgi:hypothetical protein